MVSYIRISPEEAFFQGSRWDDLCFAQLPRLGVAALRFICTAPRGDVPESVPDWHRQCGHTVTAPIELLIQASAWWSLNHYRAKFSCRVCGARYPLIQPLRAHAGPSTR